MAVITLFSILFDIDVKKNKKYLLSMIMVLTIFLAIRGPRIGLDMENYNAFFDTVKNNSFEYIITNINFELGFKIYTKIISLLSSNFRVYIFITSVISMIGVYYFIRENSKNYFSSIFMFVAFDYYIYNFCTIRQAIATSLLLLAFNFIKNGNYRKFIIATLFAFFFHKTAIVFFGLYFLKWIPSIKKYLNIYLIFCILLMFLKESLINLFTVLVYKQYLNYHDMSGRGYLMLILIFGLICFFCYLTKRVDIEKNENKLLLSMLLIAFPFQILSLTQGLLARIVLYFSYSFIILIPNYLESLDERRTFLLKIAYYTLLIVFFVLEVNRNSMYVPYSVF